MNIVICDDEAVYRNSIAEKIEKWSAENRCESSINVFPFASGEDLLEAWENGLEIHLLFMDIEIPYEANGMEIAKQIFFKDEQIPIAFVTNYSDYAVEGYTVNAIRYIMKPIRKEAIDVCLTIAWNRWKYEQTEYLTIYIGRQVIHLPMRQIMMIEAQRKQLRFVSTDQDDIYSYGVFSDYLQILPKNKFCQCHRSYLVNLAYVRRIENTKIIMANNEAVPIGRKYASELNDQFNRYYQGR